MPPNISVAMVISRAFRVLAFAWIRVWGMGRVGNAWNQKKDSVKIDTPDSILMATSTPWSDHEVFPLSAQCQRHRTEGMVDSSTGRP